METIYFRFQLVVEHGFEGGQFRIHDDNGAGYTRLAEVRTFIGNGHGPSFGRNDNKGMPGQAGHDGRGDNAVRDTTLVTSDEGPIIMNAVRDEDGNMVATDVIEAASVTARFRNVAERGGKVNIEFAVTVPQDMMVGIEHGG